MYFPEINLFVHHSIPFMVTIIELMQQSSRLVEAWCVVEAIFFVALKAHIRRLDRVDPLEASLSSAPLMEPQERQILWDRVMEAEKEHPAAFISGWFFDQDIQNISRFDVREFVTWCVFEGRNQEHLTDEELDQLEDFIQHLEDRISTEFYGFGQDVTEVEEEDNNGASDTDTGIDTYADTDTDTGTDDELLSRASRTNNPLPKKSKCACWSAFVLWCFPYCPASFLHCSPPQ